MGWKTIAYVDNSMVNGLNTLKHEQKWVICYFSAQQWRSAHCQKDLLKMCRAVMLKSLKHESQMKAHTIQCLD